MLQDENYNEILQIFSLPKPINQEIKKLYKTYIGNIIENIHTI
jgi:hypothetical protein